MKSAFARLLMQVILNSVSIPGEKDMIMSMISVGRLSSAFRIDCKILEEDIETLSRCSTRLCFLQAKVRLGFFLSSLNGCRWYSWGL